MFYLSMIYWLYRTSVLVGLSDREDNMPFIPIPDVAEVKIFAAIGNLKASFRLYFQRAGFTIDDGNDLLDFIEEDFLALENLPYSIDDSWKFDRLYLTDMRTQDGFVIDRPIDIDGDHFGSTPTVATAAYCITFKAAGRGKWNRGRNYVPGLAEDFTDEQDIQPAYVLRVVDAYKRLLNPGPANWLWVVVSRFKDKQPRAVGVSAPVATVLCRDNRIVTQRRRVRRP